jgi:N-acetylneuraminic acid mutarotase
MLLVAVRGKLYAIGGRFNDVSHNTSFNEVYDPKTDRWTEKAALPTPRSGCAGALFHGRIDVIAGERAGGIFTENESYDPVTNTWTMLAPLPDGRHGTGAAVVGNALYIPAGAPLSGGGSSTLFVFKQP